MPSVPVSPVSAFRVAVVGCGAVTRDSLLPVLAGHDQIHVVALVDSQIDRARALGAAYGLSRVHDDMSGVAAHEVDGVVLATPPAHHAPAALDLMARGLHVFVEKPMTIRLADAEAMVASADRAGVVLSVGLYRRLLPVTRLLRATLDAEMLGRPLSVDIEEGGEYSWNLATLTVLTREGGGGGVLIDLGTHLLDQLFFVLPGDVSVTRYADTARGGVETDCELELALSTRWGTVPARVELSRTRELRGTVRVVCERGTLELVRGDFSKLLVHGRPDRVVDPVSAGPRPLSVSAQWGDQGEVSGYKAFRAEFDDWIGAVRKGREPQLSGRSVVNVVRTIEACYASPTPLAEPWVDQGLLATPGVRLAPAVASGARPRVLVTGAGGFLGCRTVECLHLGGAWDVRALVRRPAGAARLARFPIDITLGDVTSPTDMAAAVKGCDAVVHCAVGTGWPPAAAFRVTVEGTRQVAEAALAAGVGRFVHVSSMAVHGAKVPLRLDEAVPLDPGTGVEYGRAKYLAERAIADASARGLRAITLRPARIYGPFSRTFTERPLKALRDGRLVLAGDAESPANMVYVDNVVESIIKSLIAPDSECGEAFLISEPEQLSWREFYQFFAAETGSEVHITPRPDAPRNRQPGLVAQWATGVREIVFSRELRGLAKKVLATDPIGTIPRRWWDRSPALQQRVQRALGIDAAITYRELASPTLEEVEFLIDPTLVVFDKASSRLGYKAAVAREHATSLTRDWARVARLLKSAVHPL